MNKTTIEIISSDRTGYSVTVNNEVILECLGEDELKNLTIDEIIKCYAGLYD